MSPSLSLQSFRDLDRTSPQFHRQLSTLLDVNGCRGVISSLEGDDLAWLVEYLDSVIASISDPSSLESKEFLRQLGRICSLRNVLPKSCLLSDSLRDFCLLPAPEGTFDASRLRIKCIGIHPNEDQQKAKQAFHQLAVVWKHLNHQKIVPLLGVTIDPLQCVSDRIPAGHLTEYIANHPDVNRPSLLSDVAEGLNYLHSCNVIHGDLNGSNILVDTAGHARITDFGLAVVTHDLPGILSEDGRGTWWIAPEILDNQGTHSKEADIFSFAGVTIEVFTGAAPFSDEPPRAATSAIIHGQRPPRPTHPDLTDGLWRLTQRCWDKEPHLRPCALRLSCGFDIPAWKSLIDHPLTSDQRITLIADIFSDRDETEAVKHLHGDDAQSFVNIIDEMLNTLTPSLRRKCLSTLCKICGCQALLPRSVQIPFCYNRMEVPLYSGGYAHIWEGEYQGQKVAVKVLTVCMTSNLDKITQMFCKEVIAWKALRHQNVLPLLGVTMSRNQFVMVSEWMTNGNINQFIEKHADANRFELLKDVARGLMYMHEEGMIHGDLKGANILIDQYGHSCLADFGLTVIVSDPAYSTTSSSHTTAGTARWMSPERHDPAQFGIKYSRPTKESDCYELGMVILEVLSGQVPFTRDCTTFMVMGKVVGGERPERPQGAEGMWFTDALWAMLQMCWSHKPNDRLTVEAVLRRLEDVSAVWQPTPCVEMNIDEPSLAVSSPVLDPQILPSPSPRLSVDSSTTGSLARGFDTIAAGSAGTGGPYPLPQLTPPPPFGELDIEGSGRTIIRQAPLEERTYVETRFLTRTQGSEEETIRVLEESGVAEYVDIDENGVGQLVPANVEENELQNLVKKDFDVTIAMTTDFNGLWAEVLTAENEAGAVQALAQILSSKEGRAFTESLEPTDGVLCIEIIDHALVEKNLPPSEKQVFFGTLRRLAGIHGRLPDSMVITDKVDILDSGQPSTWGGFADIKRGKYKGHAVAVKTMRVAVSDDFGKIRKRFCEEAVLWNSLRHRNVLRLVGVLDGFDGHTFATVAEWMVHGNIMEYIKKNASNRLKLLYGAVKGLKYLHDANITHGDLKGANILMTNDKPPTACLADFGFTTMVFDPQLSMTSGQAVHGGTMTFMAPELLVPSRYNLPDSSPTREADIYAFGLVILQVLTGEPPFRNYRPQELAYYVSCGSCPEKPADAKEIGISDSLWDLIRKCWDGKIAERPQIQEVVKGVGDAAANWHTDMPPSGTDQPENSPMDELSGDFSHGRIFPSYLSEVPPPPTTKFLRLWKDVVVSKNEAVAVRALADILVDKEGRAFVLGLDRKHADHCIDVLDHGIAGNTLKAVTEQQAFFVTLRRLAGLRGRLPESMVITEQIEINPKILASGGFADVRSGTYMGHLVAVKTLRVAAQDDLQKTRKQFCKEVILWSTLSHPHVLKLVGVYGKIEKGKFSTVSEWMKHGNVMDYIKKNAVNRLQLLYEAAQGLKYIHSVGLAHGDLKGANILISNDTPPRACLADFGSMTMVLDPKKPLSCSADFGGGTLTFMPPELLMPSLFGVKNPIHTPEGDIYTFGLVIFQVLTGQIPFPGVREAELGFCVYQGLRPNKPENASAIGFSNSLWGLTQCCWDGKMNSRPKVSEVVAHLRKEASSWHGLMPPHTPAENIACVSEAPTSDLTISCRMFESGTVTGSLTDSFPATELFRYPTTHSAEISRRLQEPSDDLLEFQHDHRRPRSALPPPKRKPFQSSKAKVREFFSRLRPTQ